LILKNLFIWNGRGDGGEGKRKTNNRDPKVQGARTAIREKHENVKKNGAPQEQGHSLRLTNGGEGEKQSAPRAGAHPTNPRTNCVQMWRFEDFIEKLLVNCYNDGILAASKPKTEGFL
jgi:hypothetical protein